MLCLSYYVLNFKSIIYKTHYALILPSYIHRSPPISCYQQPILNLDFKLSQLIRLLLTHMSSSLAIIPRHSEERGGGDYDWLKTFHTFSIDSSCVSLYHGYTYE